MVLVLRFTFYTLILDFYSSPESGKVGCDLTDYGWHVVTLPILAAAQKVIADSVALEVQVMHFSKADKTQARVNVS